MAAVMQPLIHGAGTPDADWRLWDGWQSVERVTAESLVPRGSRAIIVAPHPDDEVLGCGGLMQQLAAAQTPVIIVAVTDGTGSHPRSRRWPSWRLMAERPRESRAALDVLGVEQARWIRAGIPDGAVRDDTDRLGVLLGRLLKPSDVIFTTWRHDGHPDHEATGHACAQAAVRAGARLVEVPVWCWHWAAPGDSRVPWMRARQLPLEPEQSLRKAHAMDEFHSQIEPDSSTGNGPILQSTALQRAAWPREVFFV